MSKIKYYRLTEWTLVKRWLLICGIALAVIVTLWFITNLKFQYCPGKIDCRTAPTHSLRNWL